MSCDPCKACSFSLLYFCTFLVSAKVREESFETFSFEFHSVMWPSISNTYVLIILNYVKCESDERQSLLTPPGMARLIYFFISFFRSFYLSYMFPFSSLFLSFFYLFVLLRVSIFPCSLLFSFFLSFFVFSFYVPLFLLSCFIHLFFLSCIYFLRFFVSLFVCVFHSFFPPFFLFFLYLSFSASVSFYLLTLCQK